MGNKDEIRFLIPVSSNFACEPVIVFISQLRLIDKKAFLNIIGLNLKTEILYPIVWIGLFRP